jgi:uncharacterized protein
MVELKDTTKKVASSCCHEHSEGSIKKDYFLLTVGGVVMVAYLLHLLTTAFPIESTTTTSNSSISLIINFSSSVFQLFNQMLLGIGLGILAVGILNQIPREFVISILGRNSGFKGLLRATFAGLLLDLCSHGILLVGLKLYERGATIGQTIAFLVASPWNSLSLTIILYNLIGGVWTITFILLSLVIALISGLLFDLLVKKKLLPKNPNRRLPVVNNQQNSSSYTLKEFLSSFKPKNLQQVVISGAKDSLMIIKWLFLGVIVASLLRTVMEPSTYQDYFGSHFSGMLNTLFFATIFETCSEGSTPVAADILNFALSPGNSFLFLMAGIATDYTEVMGLKERTKSWRIALALPLIVLPQSLFWAMFLNQIG